MRTSIFRSRKSGFTLAELLMVIAILVILIGLGVTGFLALRRNIQIAKYDDLAREIYVAVQNQLTRLEANGMDKETEDTLKLGAQVSPEPEDYKTPEGNNKPWAVVEENFHRANQGDTKIMELLLPLGAVADDVRSNGFYVVEYNAKTHTVYSVFYSEKSFDYSAVSTVGGFRTSRNTRKGPMVGYYGGSSVERDELNPCPIPELEIINNNELRLNIRNVPTDTGLTVSVTVSDGIVDKPVKVDATQILDVVAVNGKTVLLDSMENEKHFYQLFPDLTPGKDLKITVTYSKPGSLSSSASITANSLFATREEGAGDTATVTLAWARHLQNLENQVSHLDDDAITIARQTEHIQWEGSFGNFASIRNEDANDNLLRYEGNGLEIRDIVGTNGLFAVTKEDMALSGIQLVNPQISAAGVSTSLSGESVGALAGTAGKGTTVTGCGVYYRKLHDTDGAIDYEAYKNCGVDGKAGITGGLIGSADSVTVTNSFAALPKLNSGSAGGGLIGSATGCTIRNSYANCDEMLTTFDSFIGGSGGNIISHCYAVANVANVSGNVETSFAAGSNTISDSYYTVSHRDFSAKEDKAATEFCYWNINGWETTDQKGMAKATAPGGWANGKGWVNMIAPLSHPYREYLDGRQFPYPAVRELDHYGSWPEGDGTVDLKITMQLLNNQKAGYAIFAGEVVVREIKEDGSEEVLFKSEDHKTDNGGFDGEDTIRVVPGTRIKISIENVKDGYEYNNTTFPDGILYEKVVEYTVRKDTEAVINFTQKTFRLTGLRAVDETGNKNIAGAGYAIDLTSPKTTLNITTADQNKKVETGSTVIVRPKIPANYFASVVWYSPKGDNSEGKRVYLTQGENGYYSFPMPAQDTDIHVMYTKEEVRFQIRYYLMDTDGKYSTEPVQVVNPYRFGLGTQINQGMIRAMADSSGLTLTLDGERVRYLASAYVTGADEKSLFQCAMDENGNVVNPGTPYITKAGDLAENESYIVHIRIARKKYQVTLNAEDHITGVGFAGEEKSPNTVSGEFYYGASVTVEAEVEPGFSFSYWDPQDPRFMMGPETTYTFQVPAFDLNLRAVAALDKHLVTIHLMENDESWLYSSESRKADPITLTLVNSLDDTETYQMKVLTDDTISYAMQAVVPSVEKYEAGYYVRVDYASGRRSWIYASGSEGGSDNDNQRLLLYVRDKETQATAKFYTVTYFPNKQDVSGTVPRGGTFPMYYHVEVEGNSGLLRNLTDGDRIFSGWKDYYAEGTGSSCTYTGGESLMLTRRTDMFAQWVSSLTVTYHAGEADGGELPVDRREYQPKETVTIQRGSLTRKGYSFLGWSMTENAVAPDFAVDGVKYELETVPLNLYPVWQREEYTIQFYNVDGTPLEGEKYTLTQRHYGDKIIAPDLEKDGKSVIFGWAATQGGQVAYQPGTAITVTGNASFYACPAAEPVTVTFLPANGGAAYKTMRFGKGISSYLNYVPETGPVTAWSTEPNGKGVLHFCQADGRSEEAIAFTEDTKLYAVTGKVYNYNQQLWDVTLGEAVKRAASGDTLIVCRDTQEPKTIWIDKNLYILSSGQRTVQWTDGATNNNGGKLKEEKTGEFVGCMGVGKVKVEFGDSDIQTLSMEGNTLTFDANRQSRVISLGSGSTFHMYDGVTLTNGYRDGEKDGNGRTERKRTGYGGGVYAGNGSVFYMHGGTISYCEAVSGGGVYLITGSRMYMGDMVKATAYSSTATYYTIQHDDGLNENIFIHADGVTRENYKQFYVTAGDPKICYNQSTQTWSEKYGDGGGGLLSLDLKNGDLILYRGSITNNTTSANGGGIVTDSGSPGDFLRIYEVDISHNTAAYYGGGILQWQGTVYVYNSTIRQNKAQKGGGIYLKNGGTTFNIEFYFGDISDNEATEAGGGVYAVDGAEFYIRGGNLCRNTAKNGGGAYLKGGGSLLSLEKGALSDNTAQGNGGGVYSEGTVDMTGSTLSGNSASNFGGGIYMTGTMHMSGGTICDNSGRYLGGGIMMGGKLRLSGGSLYGNTDTDYPPNNHKADEDNVHPGPNDIYLIGDHILTIPEGGIALSGEERVTVDCERDGGMRFKDYTPYRFAVYENPANFEAKDALLFTYYGTRSTKYSQEVNKKPDLKVVSHEELTGKDIGLYLAGKTEGDGISSFVGFDYNFTGCQNPESRKYDVAQVLDLSDKTVVDVPEREGYYLAGWARTPDALEEQYVLYYDVVENAWKSGYTSDKGWTVTAGKPEYTVQNLFSQTLYAMWKPCVVVYDLGKEAMGHGVTIQPTSIGPKVTLLNPNPPKYTVENPNGEKQDYLFKNWVDQDNQTYMPTEQLELTKNLRLTAVWEKREADTFLIILDPNGGAFAQAGEVVRQYTVKRGADSKALPDESQVTRARKQLLGWSTNQYATKEEYQPGSKVSNVIADMTLYAVWVDTFDVTYDLNGGIGPGRVESVAQGKSVTIPADWIPEKPGNTFLGWAGEKNATAAPYPQGSAFGPITSNRTLYAVWKRTLDYYIVTFDGNGGVWEEEDKLAAAKEIHTDPYNTAIIPTETPVLEKHIFLGWAKDENAAEPEYLPGGDITNLDQNTTYYAVWVPSVTVTFELDGGRGEFPAVIIKQGEQFPIPEAKPERNQHIFKGWRTSDDATAPILNFGQSISANADVTLQAVWAPYVTIQFDPTNGTGTFAPMIAEKGIHFPIPEAEPTWAGHVFLGWRTESGATDDPLKFGDRILADKDLTLYAVWRRYQVTFDANLSDASWESQVFEADESGTVPIPAEPPAKDGATFLGWAKDPNAAAGEDLQETITPTEDMTLYAVWGYTVIFDRNGGTGDTQTFRVAMSLAPEFTVPVQENPSRDGCKFMGWSKDQEGTQGLYHYGEKCGLEKDGTIYYAVWAEPVPVCLLMNDGSGSEFGRDQAGAGFSYTLPENGPERLGYTFMGWSKEASSSTVAYKPGDSMDIGKNAEPLTLYAVWEQQTWKVAFDLTGIDCTLPEGSPEPVEDKEKHVYVTYEVKGGEDVTQQAPVVSLDGYVFAGWSDGATTYEKDRVIPVTGNMTLTALWEKAPEPAIAESVPDKGEQTAATAAEAKPADAPAQPAAEADSPPTAGEENAAPQENTTAP